jgi:hypothetical protein
VGLFLNTSSRSFRVPEPPEQARRVVAGMTVADGAPGGLPPGVVAGRTGPGRFAAASPVAVFDARMEVRSDGRGGSIVTEHKTSFSPMPFMAKVADAIHDVATSPQEAYFRARRR